ncbi:LamG domain-containing protein, partial [Nitrospinae bacterium AH_259_B05_G02_I21]|nr:LamG domain-containing protein [Nitrospinae bacterium AH_259_B05_G02_I21]
LWVWLDDNTNSHSLIGKRGGTQNEYWILHQGGEGFKVRVWDGGTSTDRIASTVGVGSTGQWYFVVVWHDATANTLNIQIDDGTVDSSSYTAGINDSNSEFDLGRQPGGDYFDGRLDSVSIWKR